ncbi:hypothetical protein AQ505_07095 [Pedobacter sp. PACM 27299]|uniref:hypothetical protein n=1 Tax=Pedobacter sp. PACM 27299 TaxID=1727164 RepID=UPI000706C105|nr:hypothetical protein [Pedobacter sp. PACM 27299]ALL05277.1 hypothetical protein AQ505_07095 [Pedobacter sp. PACM 27299]
MLRSDQFKPLTTLPFLFCLLLLLINDFYLKGAFHNTLTGKLSDFCGLFIFPIFWSVFFPKRKLAIFLLTGLLFMVWKSEYSTSFIEFFSAYCFPIQRVVDHTDIIALIVLPLAWYSLNRSKWSFKLSPSFISLLAFFAFCASSVPRYHQSFNQPQYVLFKSSKLPDSMYYDGDFAVYHFDSLLVVEVKELLTTRRPIVADDHHKNIVINQLEETVRNSIQGIEGLMPPGRISYLRIKTSHYIDFLRFKGGRLDGKFIRLNGQQVLIEGYYKSGIEDSVWTYQDAKKKLLTKKTFVKGETTQIQQFKAGKLIDTRKPDTRGDVITIKYVQLVILVLMIVLMIVLVVKNYRKTYPETLQMKLVWKWVLCFTLPISVWLVQMGISVFITNHYSIPLSFVINFILIYLYTLPLFLLIIFWIKLRMKIDILWYVLLFAFLSAFFLEYLMLMELSSGV